MRNLPFILMGIMSIAYPFLVTYCADVVSPLPLILGLMGWLLLRIVLTIPRHKIPCFLMGGLLIILYARLDAQTMTHFYPIVVSVSMACVFGCSLLFPPTFVERIARLQDPHLNAAGVAYTRKVTQVWMCFCLVNAALSYLTSLHPNPTLWTLYNGCISYILMGGLMAAEYVTRRCVLQKKREQNQ